MNRPDLSCEIAGIRFKNPVITASGTFGFGREYQGFYDISQLGGVCVKGLTLKPRQGNAPPRIAETPSGILNSVGLQNPGVEAFISEELPWLRRFDTVVIANIAGNTVQEYCEMAEKVCGAGVDMVELNISCPNVKEGGIAFGVSPVQTTKVVSEARRHCSKPLIVKLTPNVSDITEPARAAEAAGADALSLINTIQGMRIDVATRRPVLNNVIGGLSGPAVRPVAVRMVWQVGSAVKLPIIGMGGISCGEDAVEMMLAGATAVSVGTACFLNPAAPLAIRDGIESYLASYGFKSVSDIVKKVVI